MREIKVLVSGVGGDVAQGVIKVLETTNLNLKVYKICVHWNSSWLHRDVNSFKAPLSNSEEYIDYLIQLINKLNIDIFFPCVDSEIYKIAISKKMIEKHTNVCVCVDSPEKIMVADDKYNTYNFLKQNNFHHPKTVIPAKLDDIDSIIDKVGFPLIAKKRISQGSTRINVIYTYASARSYIGKTEYILQEFLLSNKGEYTAGLYIGDDNKAKGICILKRELKNGSTYRAERIFNADWDKQLIEIAEKLGLKYVNVQWREKNGCLYPFEFNGRFSGTTGIIGRVFNAPEMFIRERILNEHINFTNTSEKFYVMRYFEEIFSTEEKMNALKLRSEKL